MNYILEPQSGHWADLNSHRNNSTLILWLITSKYELVFFPKIV